MIKSTNIRPQQRDIDLLELIGQIGLLDAHTIHSEFFAGKTRRLCRRRVGRLTEAGVLRRLQFAQYYSVNGAGRLPSIYALDDRGIEILRRETGNDPERSLAKHVTADFVLHELGVAKLQLAITRACERGEVATPQWLREYDPTPAYAENPSPQLKFAERYILHETFDLKPKSKQRSATQKVGQNGRPIETMELSIRPDASFLLEFAGRCLIGYIEYDRSSESLRRAVGHKLRGYQLLIDQKRFRNHWPNCQDDNPAVRIFYVCKTQMRIENMRAFVGSRQGAEILRFAVETDVLKPDYTISDTCWQDTGGTRVAVVRKT